MKNLKYGNLDYSDIDANVVCYVRDTNNSLMISYHSVYTYVGDESVLTITEIMLHQTEDVRHIEDVLNNLVHLVLSLSAINTKVNYEKIIFDKDLVLINKHRSFYSKGAIKFYTYLETLLGNTICANIEMFLNNAYGLKLNLTNKTPFVIEDEYIVLSKVFMETTIDQINVEIQELNEATYSDLELFDLDGDIVLIEKTMLSYRYDVCEEVKKINEVYNCIEELYSPLCDTIAALEPLVNENNPMAIDLIKTFKETLSKIEPYTEDTIVLENEYTLEELKEFTEIK